MEIISKYHFKIKTHFEVNELLTNILGYWINVRGFNIQVDKGINLHLVSRQWSQWQYMIYSIFIYVCLSGFCEWWTYVTIQACMYVEARPFELLFLRCFSYCFSPGLELNKRTMLVDQWATKIHLFLSPQHWACKDTILHSAFCSLGSRDWTRDHKGKLNHLTGPWEIIICLKMVTTGKVHCTVVICHQMN